MRIKKESMYFSLSRGMVSHIESNDPASFCSVGIDDEDIGENNRAILITKEREREKKGYFACVIH